jgi:hypothetical protein
MDALTLFGLLAVTAMLIFYALRIAAGGGTPDPVRRGRLGGGSPLRFFGLSDHRKTITGIFAWFRTFCVTLPISMPRSPPWPCVAITMRSHFFFCATFTMPSSG